MLTESGEGPLDHFGAAGLLDERRVVAGVEHEVGKRGEPVERRGVTRHVYRKNRITSIVTKART